ncbi:Threonine dehydrogenase and related Zn-dependent dehydrogenases [[Actinomadura] parvosata subsp. kistnae]|uniref:Uncharacterized protein n=1 Tax=[Actinomadura] parvosata subsp. kistnae TaxID=1909395 RepID=A0A1U9ZV74_9ACTN|nr:hypothetical protein [Nonomuraea sp. ATCC 55076]AQZ61842.1 hypothetical protein BKM31_10490 [Nonomuraea sp. ATCC 55076]SPL87981.1 Threonine dehydrogenase and related Zn-dependent dehydrogenases [Actinomadura parvosata subsp. kistnae]
MAGAGQSTAIGTRSQLARVPPADGTLVATPGMPDLDLVPGLPAASDVLGTGWFAPAGAGPPVRRHRPRHPSAIKVLLQP